MSKVMKYNISPRLEHLRRKNRYLLQQLETNSELLEKRLKALRQEARLSGSSERVNELPGGSPYKRKYDAWKTRNNSKNVAFILGMSREQQSEGSSDEHFTHVRKQIVNKSHVAKYATPPSANKIRRPATTPSASKVRRAETPPSANTIRRPVLIVSGHKKKKLSHSHGRSPKKHKRQSGNAKKRVYKPCPECYCPGIVVSDESDIENHRFYTRNTVNHKFSKSCRCKIPQSKLETKKVEINHPKRSYKDKEFQSLLSARDMITYSPQSVFLRRLRRQSRSIRNMLFKDTATQTKKGGIAHSSGTSDEEESSSQDSVIKDDVKLGKCKSTDCGLEAPLRKAQPDTVSGRGKVHECGDQTRIKDLGKYRRMHWFDCHAETPEFYARNPRLFFNHSCVHRFIVNDRYMAQPVLEDHEGHSRCEICLLSEPPRPSADKEFPEYEKPVITLPVIHTEGDRCGFTSRRNNNKDVERDYGEVDYITQSNLYSEAYGGERKTCSSNGERELVKNVDQGNKPRLRGGTDVDTNSEPVDVPLEKMKKKTRHSNSVKGVGDYERSVKTLFESASAGKTNSESASSPSSSVKINCLSASQKKQKCPMARLDKVQSQAPKLSKPIVSVTVPLSKAGNKRLGPFPPKSRVFADPITIGLGRPVHAVRPPAPVNSLALRYQKGVC